jgi:hypothetical protein
LREGVYPPTCSKTFELNIEHPIPDRKRLAEVGNLECDRISGIAAARMLNRDIAIIKAEHLGTVPGQIGCAIARPGSGLKNALAFNKG